MRGCLPASTGCGASRVPGWAGVSRRTWVRLAAARRGSGRGAVPGVILICGPRGGRRVRAPGRGRLCRTAGPPFAGGARTPVCWAWRRRAGTSNPLRPRLPLRDRRTAPSRPVRTCCWQPPVTPAGASPVRRASRSRSMVRQVDVEVRTESRSPRLIARWAGDQRHRDGQVRRRQVDRRPGELLGGRRSHEVLQRRRWQPPRRAAALDPDCPLEQQTSKSRAATSTGRPTPQCTSSCIRRTTG